MFSLEVDPLRLFPFGECKGDKKSLCEALVLEGIPEAVLDAVLLKCELDVL